MHPKIQALLDRFQATLIITAKADPDQMTESEVASHLASLVSTLNAINILIEDGIIAKGPNWSEGK